MAHSNINYEWQHHNNKKNTLLTPKSINHKWKNKNGDLILLKIVNDHKYLSNLANKIAKCSQTGQAKGEEA